MTIALTAEMSARVAERRACDWAFSWPAGTDVAALSEADIAAMIEAEDAQALALTQRDRAEEDARLATLGLTRGQIVRATGRGTHHDSHGAEVIELGYTMWRVVGLDCSGVNYSARVFLNPEPAGQPGGHYALVRPERIIR